MKERKMIFNLENMTIEYHEREEMFHIEVPHGMYLNYDDINDVIGFLEKAKWKLNGEENE